MLEHFVRGVQCRGMFSTHYHRLAVDYQSDPKVCQKFVSFCKTNYNNFFLFFKKKIIIIIIT